MITAPLTASIRREANTGADVSPVPGVPEPLPVLPAVLPPALPVTALPALPETLLPVPPEVPLPVAGSVSGDVSL